MAAFLRRSLLYVPASSAKMLAKSQTLASDNLTFDLEDAVTETAKAGARVALRAHLEGIVAARAAARAATGEQDRIRTTTPEIAVRINAVSTRHALADLVALGSRALAAVDAIVVPKVDTPADLTFVADVVRHLWQDSDNGDGDGDDHGQRRPPPKLIALIESARAVMDLGAICAAGRTTMDPAHTVHTSSAAPSSPRLDGLIFAAEDFALDLSITRTPSLGEFQYARSAVVTAARAFRLTSALDLVCTAFRGDAGLATLAAECRNGRGMGFTGKQCIHPSQVAVVQRVFGGTDSTDSAGAGSGHGLAWAVRVLAAGGHAAAAGRGAFVLDGAMIDAPVLGKARQMVGLAERAGAGDEVAMLRDQYRDQQPE